MPPVSIFDKCNIQRLEARFGVFGEYTEKLLCAVDAVKCSEDLVIYADLALSYLYAVKARSEVVKLKLPEIEENSLLRFYPLLILAALLPNGIKEYERRGFSEEEIYQNLNNTFGARVAMSERLTGLMGLDSSGFSWLSLYCYAQVFRAGVFNVTPKFLPDNILLLKNKNTGEYATLMTEGQFHRSGMLLLNPGYTDTEFSFTASFCETDTEFIGHPCLDSLVFPTPVPYKKTIWEPVIKKGDGVAGLHIPRGADLTPRSIDESFSLVLKLTRERYPEYDAKTIHCASWMLDPKLAELLGDGAKLSGFLTRFLKYPHSSDGNAVFTFVFPKKYPSHDELPEDTTLQRKLKSLYANGGYIHIYGGIIPH